MHSFPFQSLRFIRCVEILSPEEAKDDDVMPPCNRAAVLNLGGEKGNRTMRLFRCAEIPSPEGAKENSPGRKPGG